MTAKGRRSNEGLRKPKGPAKRRIGNGQIRQKGPLTKTLIEYGGSTTIHGIPYILEDGRLLLERVLWVVIVTLCACVSMSFTIKIYSNWDQDPISVSVSTTEYEIENIEYPSITICAQGSVGEITGMQCNV